MRRRTVLKSLALVPTAGLVPLVFRALPASALPLNYPQLRARWNEIITGAAAIDPADQRFAEALAAVVARAAVAAGALDHSAARTRVFVDAPLEQNAGVLLTYRRLEHLAVAWATPGTEQFDDDEVLDDVVAGIRTAHQGYNAATPEHGNWWTWEIGVPRALSTAATIVFDHLTAQDVEAICDAIDFYVPDPWFVLPAGSGRKESTGANRVDLCGAVMIRSLLDGDTARLEHARAGLTDAWTLVATGDGFYTDGSFMQHSTIPYTGSYGVVLTQALARLFALLEPAAGGAHEDFFDLVDRSLLPVVYRGQVLDSVRGRAISRAAVRSRDVAADLMEALVTMSSAAPVAVADRWLARCSSWWEDLEGTVAMSTVSRVAAVRSLEASPVQPEQEPSGVTLFGSMDRAIVRRTDWAYAIAGSSRRVSWYECGNGENDRGCHTGSGMGYLYDDDTAHFDDGFWPTVDLSRLPGTTADQTVLPDRVGGQWGAGRPNGDWTGGVVGEPGAVEATLAFGQDLRGPGGTGLRARKAWFSHGDVIVALGADIRSSSGGLVETVVENRNLHYWGGQEVIVDGATSIASDGSSSTVHSPGWAHLEGVGGYLFGPGTVLKLRREQRSGSWSAINTGGSSGTILRRYVTFWLWHGAFPPGRGYEYALLPGVTAAAAADAATERPYAVLANSATMQAVQFANGGPTAVIAWAPGVVAGVEVDGPGAVVVTDDADRREVAIAAHGGELGGELVVTMPTASYGSVLESDGCEVLIRPGFVDVTVPRESTPRQRNVVLGSA